MWGYGPYGMMGYGDGWGSGGWMMLFGGFFWIILLAIGIAAVVWIVRAGTHGGHYAPPRIQRGSSGLDVLEERYARGELNRDEFLQKKRDILGPSGAA
jgi:putative membrane protein